ncbi:hypothetical protein Tco_0967458 [Tanacetum coccineum]
MSMMGELKFFLGLQVYQSPRDIFISQLQYAIKLLKKHGIDECGSMSTSMTTVKLDADLHSTPNDQTKYRSMIRGLMYLIVSRPDIAFATFVSARYQARHTVKHLKEVKRIFRYLRQSYNIYNMGLWYSKDSGFKLIAYSDADHAGCHDDCKSTSRGLQFLAEKLLDDSKYKFKFFLDTKELTLSIADIRCIFQLPQATNNNNTGFVDAPSFSHMVSFFLDDLGFSLQLRSPSNFVYQVDVPTTQSQLIEYTQGTHRKLSAFRTPNPVTTEGESSAQRKPNVIRFRVPRRPDPETLIPTAADIDITSLDETIQMSIATQRSLEDFEAQQNVAKVKEHMVDEEIEQLVEENENVNVDAFMDDILNDQEDHDTRIEPRNDKESTKVTKSVNMLIIHDNKEEEGSSGDEFELKMRENRKGIEESKDTPPPTPIRSLRTHTAPLSMDKETLKELTVTTEDAPSSSDKEKLQELTVTDSTPSSSLRKPKTDANKKFNLVTPQCPNESKILTDILNNHPLRFRVATSASPILGRVENDDLASQSSTLGRIRFRVPRRPDPETLIPIAVEIDITSLDETIQMSIATQRSIEDFEAQQNVVKVKKHMVDEEIEQLVEENENVDVDAFMDDILNDQEDYDTRIKPRSDKESTKVTKSVNMLIIHDNEEEEGSSGDEFELKRRENRKGIEESKDTPPPTPIRSLRTHTAPLSMDKETLKELTVTTEDAPSSLDKEKLQELTVTDSTPSSSSPKLKTGRFRWYKSFIK